MYQNDAHGYSDISEMIEEILREDQSFFDNQPQWKSWSADASVKEQMVSDPC